MMPTILTIPLMQMASGDRLYIQVYKFAGATSGKKAYLQSNLHGAEISGNAVLHQLIEYLVGLDSENLCGEIWLVPACNPLGTNQRSHHFSSGRYNIFDGKDWNRIFWDYEKEEQDLTAFAQSQLNCEPAEIRQNYLRRIQESFAAQGKKLDSPSSAPLRELYRYRLQSLCLDANYVIDCHSSTNQGLDYLYCFPTREESAKGFLLDYGLLLNEYDGNTFDEAFLKPWLALEKILADLGKPIQFDLESWTLELGAGMVMNPESVAKGVRGIKNYLAQKGILNIPGFPLPETDSHKIAFTPRTQVQKYYALTGGMIQNRVELGSYVKTGDLLYQVLSFNKKSQLPKTIDVQASDSGLVFDLSTNHSVNQADYILSLMKDSYSGQQPAVSGQL